VFRTKRGGITKGGGSTGVGGGRSEGVWKEVSEEEQKDTMANGKHGVNVLT